MRRRRAAAAPTSSASTRRWGRPLDPGAVLAPHPSPEVIAVVHAETSTGVRTDLEELGRGKGDALLLVDTVTSLGGIPVEVDAWGIDIAYSATQKCLGVPPGLSPLTVSERARERFVERSQSWYLDLRLISDYVSADAGRRYHHTAPTAMVAALHAGLGARARRGPRAGLGTARGLRRGAAGRLREARVPAASPPMAAGCPSSPACGVPEGVDEAVVRRSCSTSSASRSVAGSAPCRQGVAHRVHGPRGAASQRHPPAGRCGRAARTTMRRSSRSGSTECSTRPPPCSAAASCCAPSCWPTSRRGARSACATRTGCSSGSRRGSPGMPDPTARPRRLRRAVQRPRARAPARRRLRVRHLRRQRLRRRDQPQLGAAGPVPERATWATGSTRRSAGNGYMPESVVVLARFAFDELRLHRLQIADHPPQHAQPPGGGEAAASATRAWPCATSRSTARGRTTCATPSPPRSGSQRRDELETEWL